MAAPSWRRSGAYSVYEDPADLLLHLDEVGVRERGAEARRVPLSTRLRPEATASESPAADQPLSIPDHPRSTTQ